MKYFKNITAVLLMATTFVACEKKQTIENPEPVEQELITTVQLVVINENVSVDSFIYKVDNGFGSSSQGNVTINDVKLKPNTEYKVQVYVLNEAETPAENITEEVIQESHHHLFVYESSPVTGSGSIAFSEGSKDDEGEPFNQTIKFKTGDAGNGTLTVTLKHEPTDKTATTPAAAGGETDAQAVFPVILQ